MPMRAGIPLISEVDAAVNGELYRDMIASSDRFRRSACGLLRWYRWSAMSGSLRNWSRRWEYPFAAERVLALGAERRDAPLRILDAGSGITFFPYFLSDRLPGAEVVCCDAKRSYGGMFSRINRTLGRASVRFVHADLRELPFERASFDGISCVSVLEHTDRHAEIVAEFARVLRPGGRLVVTFDISLDGRRPVTPEDAERLLGFIGDRFRFPPGFDALSELKRVEEPGRILTTDHVRRTEPALLPWKYPRMKSFYDLLSGRGWSGGFYSLAVYCLEAEAR